MRPVFRLLFAAAVLAGMTPARAADLALRPSLEAADAAPLITAKSWFVHIGPAALILDEGAKIKGAGTRIPGATIKIAPQVTASLEAGYYLTPNVAVAVTLGVPLNPTINGAGTVEAIGKLGSIWYGPTAATAQYHFTNFGPFQPYVGVGPLLLIVFSEHDGALSHFRVDPALGAVAQVGADVMLSDRWGVFVDVKKGYLRTHSKGYLGALPISADVKLDPLVVSGGVTYRF